LPLDTRLAGSNPAEDDGFLRAKKFGAHVVSEAVKLSAPFHKILLHIKAPAEYDRDNSLAKLTDISSQVSLCFASGCFCWIFQRSLGINQND
jgi:hypothetical protein